MLRIVQNTSSASAGSYFTAADYYIDGTPGQELAGTWRGRGAAKLGLSGTVDQKDWKSLCDNLDPRTGHSLTVRSRLDRSVGYDFVFNLPKSASLLYAVTGDGRILDACRESVDATMEEIEAEFKTRVRRDGKNEDRITGTMVYGQFVHFTSRPVDGVPDPHLHVHCFVQNVTFDSEEGRWKAGQFRELKRDAPFFEARFHSRLADRMKQLGVPVERQKRGWEIAGIAKSTLDKFSRRTQAIEKKAREDGITSAIGKAELGAKTRERKAKNLTMGELRQEWRSRMTDDEYRDLELAAQGIGGPAIAEDRLAADTAVRLGIDHSFERKSVVPERVVLGEAIRRAVGLSTIATVEKAFKRQPFIVDDRDGRRFVTTPAVLAQEMRMLDFARNGRGTCRPLGNASHEFKRQHLNAGQRLAILHVLTSYDRVIIIRGGAGTGKTTSLLETVIAIEAGGTKVFCFAPSAAASRGVMAQEGFKDADTVARLLKDEALQKQVRGSVILVDEAGLMSMKSTAELFDLADRVDARVILAGDKMQHSSVERSGALHLLETEAGLIPASIRDIQRQRGKYKMAVRALSEGKTHEGFQRLNELGWIKEVDNEKRYELMAKEYVDVVTSGKSALVVSPTHVEAAQITAAIRDELKQRPARPVRKGSRRARFIGSDERQITVLQNMNLTRGERADAVNFSPADVLVYHQNAPGVSKGERRIVGKAGVPIADADRFNAFRTTTMAVAPGDLLRVTRNGKTQDGHRLNNGQIVTVKSFNRDGDLVLENGWTLGKDFGFLAYGFVTTSHSSQGRTVDHVLIGQSSESFGASSAEQMYVSVSRGRTKATLFTDNKAALREAVSRTDDRESATEFVAARARREKVTVIQRTERMHELGLASAIAGRSKEHREVSRE
jgi:conjugative relaxase-like TrwC/TraI family protein